MSLISKQKKLPTTVFSNIRWKTVAPVITLFIQCMAGAVVLARLKQARSLVGNEEEE